MSSPRNPHQLLLVKQLYEDARLYSEREDSFSHTKAVILLDLSVETLLNSLVLNFDPDLVINASKGSQDTDRRTLWGNAVTALSKAKNKRLVESRELSSLHALRNLVQHNGTEPTQTEVKRYLAAAAIMIGNAFSDAYGLNFENFRLWDFVPNISLRRWLQHYEDQLNTGDPVRCIAGCVIAYKRIIGAVTKKTLGNTHQRESGTKVKRFVSAAFNEYPMRNAFEAVADEFEELQGELQQRCDLLELEVVTIGVGMPVMDTRRFLQSSNGVAIADYGGGQIDVAGIWPPDPERDTERATFMLNYLSRLIRLIEEGYPGALDDLKLELKKQTE